MACFGNNIGGSTMNKTTDNSTMIFEDVISTMNYYIYVSICILILIEKLTLPLNYYYYYYH